MSNDNNNCKHIGNIDTKITEDSLETLTTLEYIDSHQETMTDKENTQTKVDVRSRQGSFVIGLHPVSNDMCFGSESINTENSKTNSQVAEIKTQ